VGSLGKKRRILPPTTSTIEKGLHSFGWHKGGEEKSQILKFWPRIALKNNEGGKRSPCAEKRGKETGRKNTIFPKKTQWVIKNERNGAKVGSARWQRKLTKGKFLNGGTLGQTVVDHEKNAARTTNRRKKKEKRRWGSSEEEP